MLLLNDQPCGIHTQFVELASELSSVNIIPDDTDHLNRRRLERGQIRHNVRGASERIIMPADRLSLQAGLDRHFRAARIEQPVGVDTEIAIDGDFDVFYPFQDLRDVFCFHNPVNFP